MSRRVQQAPLYDEASGFNGKGWVGDLLCVAERITESLEDVIWSFYIIPNILTVIILFSCGRDDLAVFKGRNRQLEITGGSDGYGPSHRTRSSEKALGREPRASLLTIWFLKQLVLQKNNWKNILYDMVMFFLMKFQTDLVSERLWNSWIFLHFQKSNGCFRCADDCMIHGEVKDGGLRRMAKEQGRMPFKSPWRDEQIEVGRLDSFFIGICEETDGFQPLGHTLYHTQNYSILIWCKL